MKKIKRLMIFILSSLVIMVTCLTIDYSRISSKQNPLFSFFKLYDIDDELYPYNMYFGPLYYIKIQNKTGTHTNIDINESSRVEMGLWFNDSKVVFEQEFTYQ